MIDYNIPRYKVAKMLLEIGAIKLKPKRPFQWSSGWKSPIYCDNRLSLSYPEVRTYIRDGLVNLAKTQFGQIDAVAGVATAGIPQGALIADQMDLPYLYVRSKPKGHGMENLIEGKIEKKQKVLVVEDLVSTGGSSLKASDAIIASGGKVVGMVSIFTYGFDLAKENFNKAKIELRTLSDYAALLEVALEMKKINDKELVLLKSWRVDPENWNK